MQNLNALIKRQEPNLKQINNYNMAPYNNDTLYYKSDIGYSGVFEDGNKNPLLSTTSRDVLFDTISIIINQLAYVDHLFEIVLDLQQKQADNGFNETIDNQINNQLILINKSINIRRELMLQIEKEHDSNHLYWCSVKHAIDSFGKSVEVYTAYLKTDNGEYKQFYFNNMKENQEIMVATLSLWLGMEDFVTCARCFSDRLAESKVDK